MKTNARKKFSNRLDAVLGSVGSSVEHQQELKIVAVDQLVAGKYQPRREFDQASLQELSDSILSQGVLQPIITREVGSNKYEILAGERRWRAAKMAGLHQVSIITCKISDESALAYGLVENIQRQDLNPIEEALALSRLIEEFNMTHEKIAQLIGRSRAAVSNMIRLLRLSKPVQGLLIAHKLDVGHARLLLVFPMDEQLDIANHVVEKKLNVRAAEQFVKRLKSGISDIKNNGRHPSCHAWSKELSLLLSTKTDVKLDNYGAGKIIVNIESSRVIERLLEILR